MFKRFSLRGSVLGLSATAVLGLSATSVILPTPSHGAEQWNMKMINVNDRLRRYGNNAANVVVGVLDTPIDLTTSSLNVMRPITLYDGATTVNAAHGTHVAGTIGGNAGTGVASGVLIQDTSVLSPNTGGWAIGSINAAIAATQRHRINPNTGEAVPRATILNMSFGYGGGYTLDRDEYLTFGKWRNVLMVKAAGNDGEDLLSLKTSKGAKFKLRNLMMIGSVGRRKRISSFSNRPGSGCFAKYIRRKWVCREQDKYKYFFMVAPGEGVRSTIPGGRHAKFSGTSMATPHVAGAAALLQGRWSVLRNRPWATANILFRSATDLGKKGVDEVYGWGLLNVGRAFSPVGRRSLRDSRKLYPAGTSGLSGTGTLVRMIRSTASVNSISMFDEYDRDFSTPFDNYAKQNSSSLGNFMAGFLSKKSNPSLQQVNAGSSFKLYDSITADFSLFGFAEKSQTAGNGDFGSALMNDYFVQSPHFNDPHQSGGSKTQGANTLTSWNMNVSDSATGLGVFAGENSVAALGFTDLHSMRPKALEGAAGLENPVLGFATSGFHLGSSYQPSDNVKVTLGYVESAKQEFLTSEYQASAPFIGVKAGITDGFDLGINIAQLNEDAGMFGTLGSGAFSLGDSFSTNAMTVSATFRPANNWSLAAAYTLAETRQENGSDFFTLRGPLLSDAMALGLTRSNLFAQQDRVNFTASLPLQTIRGSASSTVASHYNEHGDLITNTFTQDLTETSSNRQLDLTLGYSAPMGSGEFSVGSFASFNINGTDDKDIGGFASYKMKF